MTRIPCSINNIFPGEVVIDHENKRISPPILLDKHWFNRLFGWSFDMVMTFLAWYQVEVCNYEEPVFMCKFDTECKEEMNKAIEYQLDENLV